MKTRELIRQLQETDPSGELECCIDNADILYVCAPEAYWDGCLQVLERDPANLFYNVTGAEYRAGGRKVSIRTHSVEDALLDNAELPVTFDGPYARRKYEHQVNEWREDTRRINAEIASDKAAAKVAGP